MKTLMISLLAGVLVTACAPNTNSASTVKDDNSTATTSTDTSTDTSADAPIATDDGEASHSSPTNPPSQCLGSPSAWKINVLAAMLDDNVTGAKTSDIKQTGFDDHDPEYTVTVSGTVYKVSCDDSGDDDCQCSVD